MTPLAAWHHRVLILTHTLRERHPEHRTALDRIAHTTPCLPPCPSCHLRHKGPCPCPTCHTPHRRECAPPPHRPRPGCLACQLLDDTTLATNLADLGDGIRSPALEGSHSAGGHSTPTETAGESPNLGRDAGHLARSADHRDEALAWLQTALRATTTPEAGLRAGEAKPAGGESNHDAGTVRHIDHAAREMRDALAALHPLLPYAGTQRQAGQGDPGCTSCKRINTYSPVPKDGSSATLCEWCYRWKAANAHLPPEGVLQARAQGKRITSRVVDEATRAERRPKRKKAKR